MLCPPPTKEGDCDILLTQFKCKHMQIILLLNYGAETDFFFLLVFRQDGKIIFFYLLLSQFVCFFLAYQKPGF